MKVGNILVMFQTIAGIAKRLDITGIIGATCKPRDDVVCFKIFFRTTPKTLVTDELSLLFLRKLDLVPSNAYHTKMLFDGLVDTAIHSHSSRDNLSCIGAKSAFSVGFRNRIPSLLTNLVSGKFLRNHLVSTFVGACGSIRAAFDICIRAVEWFAAYLANKDSWGGHTRHFDFLVITVAEISMVRR